MAEETGEKQRSTFITVVAWIFIVITGFGTLMTLLQNIMIATIFPMAEMQEAMTHQEEFQDMPFFAKFMFNHFQLYFLFMFFLTATTLASAIGLLKRKQWARKAFIVVLGFGIVFVVFGFVVQLLFDPMANGMAQEQLQAEFTRMMTIMKVFMFIITAGITGLFSWIIKKLVSKDIVGEFAQSAELV